MPHLRPLVAATLALLASVALAGEIVVTATGTVWAEPDQATLEVGWSGVEREVGAAVARSDAAIAAIRAALAAVGVDPLDVRTSSYGLWREERWDEGGEPQLAGYRVHHLLQVTIRDLDALGRTIAAATDGGANQIGGIYFVVADADALQSEARTLAFERARQRAEELAALAGQALGSATSIEEVDATPWWPGAVAFEMEGRGGAPIAAGRQAVSVTLKVAFGADD
jgi:uncharacterized protein